MVPATSGGWRTSSFSKDGDECFAVAPAPLGIQFRHSRQPDGPIFQFTTEQWLMFLAEVISDQITNTNGAVHVSADADGWTLCELTTGKLLSFTRGEVRAFQQGAQAGEFASANLVNVVQQAD
ncbi:MULTISPECIES: DUF397 domain-containing protein [unclassified Crossiella]|uniref:DUF397 domain-containing protein n=1 Tax=unclassified Crossiella TaxID=2620835 RepID=UPI001FFF8511|nr:MULTISPECIES: DUF397 domain-containing protein [unclassified Crossiella]MCK2240939.1 DUF397 domain-containing protein [Crossiella sp. S99.2]MCK2253917.1 DUF397 domain-containing protein [Crossiella sp. S99.1]